MHQSHNLGNSGFFFVKKADTDSYKSVVKSIEEFTLAIYSMLGVTILFKSWFKACLIVQTATGLLLAIVSARTFNSFNNSSLLWVTLDTRPN